MAFMRYVGQGHEIPVALPPQGLTAADVLGIRAAYDAEYTRFYDRPVPGSDVEIMSFAVLVATVIDDVATMRGEVATVPATPARTQLVRDSVTAEVSEWGIHDRAALAPGATLRGPAIIAEDETSTLVGPGWSASINALGYIELFREARG